jgi:hypothetical protein
MSKDIRGSPMSMRDHYVTRAAELHARAFHESDESKRREYANLARQFLRLAEEAKRKTSVDRPRLDQFQSELDGPTKSLATTKTRHLVDVFDERYALHVYQYADNLWIADGDFLGHQLRTIERTLQKAVRSCQNAAIEKRLFSDGWAGTDG